MWDQIQAGLKASQWNVLFVSHLQSDLEKYKDEIFLQTENREGFLEEPKQIFYLYK